MTSVKAHFPREEWHVALLMGQLFRTVGEVFAAEDWGGLRQSHFRVISAVPAEGVTITDLAERLAMTKQGCGQFVGGLVDTGHLTVETDPSDRRVRVVRRTSEGERVTRAVTARITALEQEWAAQVGQRRYATFRRVLEEIAVELPAAQASER